MKSGSGVFISSTVHNPSDDRAHEYPASLVEEQMSPVEDKQTQKFVSEPSLSSMAHASRDDVADEYPISPMDEKVPLVENELKAKSEASPISVEELILVPPLEDEMVP